MDFATFIGDKIFDHIFRNQAYTPPGTIYLSAHTGDPGLTGANEVTGSGYARQALALNASSGKTVVNTSQIQIPMPSAGGPFVTSYLGVWDASTAGNFMFRVPYTGTTQEINVAAATDLFTSGAVHGFTTDDRVVFEAGNIGPALPTGIVAGTLYFVLASGLTTTAFKVSTTSGGSALDVTADGECFVRKLVPQSLNAGQLLQVSAGQLTLKD